MQCFNPHASLPPIALSYHPHNIKALGLVRARHYDQTLETDLSILVGGILLNRAALGSPGITPPSDAIRSGPALGIPRVRDCVTRELMKHYFLTTLGLISLILQVVSGSAKEQSKAAVELQMLVKTIHTKLDQGKSSRTDLAVELKKFESLLAEYRDQKTDDVANILFTEAKLYLQVLDDGETSRKLAEQLKQDFPNTTQGRMADELVASITAHDAAKRIQAALVPGVQFPGFDEKDVDRKRLSLSEYRGKVVLVDFWATWSKPSVAELGNTLKVYEKCHGQGFEIIGINLDVDEMLVTAFKVQRGLPWQQFFDGGGWKNKLAVKCGIDRIPANYLLNRQGNIIGKNLFGPALQTEVTRALSQE